MDREQLADLLRALARGEQTVDAALDRLRALPFEDLGFARLDHHRSLRNGFGEVVFGAGKTAEQIVAIADRLATAAGNVLVTRLDADAAAALGRAVPGFRYHDVARLAIRQVRPVEPIGTGPLFVLSAGTADLPVAEEAALSAEFLGARVERLYDVGVAGIHRLLAEHQRLWEAAVLVVVAGMEGALPSVVGGLVDRPVIGVPTSVGYGASFGGIAALLAMLNSCAAGVTIVNIDNGFGAAAAAVRILQRSS
ncbi:MAG TPA: nickel pincer cofactor biosynthesis protein LarB [Candidatus Eisenbacteria bacterium]|nr:nickel pincer cofactor biosynthesis protein LarB [Candidatus Eisenbacteria bacterium]